jgi:hypothetical protein
MPLEGSSKPVCPQTGVTVPECSCPRCLHEQLRRFQPELLEADPLGEIHVTKAPNRRQPGKRHRPAA